MDVGDGIVIGVIIGVLGSFLVFFLCGEFDSIINPEQLGEYMCEQHDTDFVDYEIQFDRNKIEHFKVECSNRYEEPLEDGYLVVIR